MSEVTHRFVVETALAATAEKTGGRWALQGVNVVPAVEAEKVSLRVTDGRRAVAVIAAGTASEPALVPALALKVGAHGVQAELNGSLKVTTPAPKGKPSTVKEYTDGRIVDGRFPSFSGVIPNSVKEGYATVCLDYQFLTEIAAAIRPKGASDEKRVLTIHVPLQGVAPVVFRYEENIGVIQSCEPDADEAEQYEAAYQAHNFSVN